MQKEDDRPLCKEKESSMTCSVGSGGLLSPLCTRKWSPSHGSQPCLCPLEKYTTDLKFWTIPCSQCSLNLCRTHCLNITVTMQHKGTCNHMQKCLDTLQVIRRGTGSEIPGCQSTKKSGHYLLSYVPYRGLPDGWGQLPGTANGTQPLLFPPY